MPEPDADLRAILIPVGGESLLLPAAVVVEITGFVQARPVPEAPPWLAGMLNWRRLAIPLVDFERALGQPASPVPGYRAVVLRMLDGSIGLRGFYALRAAATPRVLRVNAELVHSLAEPPGGPPYVAARVSVADGEAAVIPDLDRLQQAVLDAWPADTGQ
jgi:chemosensory pili system protein ChpC